MQLVSVIGSVNAENYAERLATFLNRPEVSYSQVSYSIAYHPSGKIFHSATVVYTVREEKSEGWATQNLRKGRSPLMGN